MMRIFRRDFLPSLMASSTITCQTSRYLLIPSLSHVLNGHPNLLQVMEHCRVKSHMSGNQSFSLRSKNAEKFNSVMNAVQSATSMEMRVNVGFSFPMTLLKPLTSIPKPIL